MLSPFRISFPLFVMLIFDSKINFHCCHPSVKYLNRRRVHSTSSSDSYQKIKFVLISWTLKCFAIANETAVEMKIVISIISSHRELKRQEISMTTKRSRDGKLKIPRDTNEAEFVGGSSKVCHLIFNSILKKSFMIRMDRLNLREFESIKNINLMLPAKTDDWN